MMRKGHGKGHKSAPGPRIEVLPAEDLPKPVPGRVRSGGATKIKLARKLMIEAHGKAAWHSHLELADQFRRAQCKELALQAGGVCGISPSAVVANAALQLAVSRWMFQRGVETDDSNLLRMASGIANDSRQNLLAAYELAVRGAKAMKDYAPGSPHRALQEALAEEEDEDA